jgi:aryl-alcohol dehydrogenase-like predicted oxidoreductase
MYDRNFTPSGPPVSEVGIGTWQLGGSEWGDIDDATAQQILDVSYDQGVTFYDTADIYGHGRSESLIGQFLRRRGLKGKVFVATKLGRRLGYPDDYSRQLFEQCIDESLQRLGVETLDLIQTHCIPNEWMKRDETWGWLDDLKAKGKIQRYGASVETMDEALTCLDKPGVESLQIIFNVFRQKPLEEVLPKAKEQGVAIIVRLPLASGLLAGKMRKGMTFPENDHRHYNANGEKFNVGETFAGLPFEKGVELADELKGRVRAGETMAQFTQRWILDHDAVTTIIPGASKVEQGRSNAKVSDLPRLTDELHGELAGWYQSDVKEHIRGGY